MRKLTAVLIILAVLTSLAPSLYAKDMGDKLTRGACNIVTGLPAQIITNIGQEWEASNNAAVGIFAGFVKGTVLGVCRVGSGVWDLVTFPVAIPKDYEALAKPDYLFSIK